MSASSSLLFDHCLWMLLLMPCLGLILTYSTDLGHHHGIKLLYQLCFNQ